MKDNFGFGIVGCGLIGDVHAKAIEGIEDAKIVGVYDNIEEKSKEFAEKHNTKYYLDFKSMLKDEEIDIINICTPSGLHAEFAIESANAKKHVIVEKPIEVSLEKAQMMIDECKKNGVKLAVIFQQRFFSCMKKLYNAIKENKLGKLVLGDVQVKWYRTQEYYSNSSWHGRWALDGGGALINQSIHYIDLLQWMMGPVDEVSGYIGTLAHKMEAEDTGVAILKFGNGALGVIEGTTGAYPGFSQRLEVYGDKGGVIIEDGKIKSWKIIGEEDKEVEKEEFKIGAAKDPSAIPVELHRFQIKDMIDAIKENREPVVNGEEGKKSLEIILAIYASSKTNERIKLRRE